MPHIIILVYDEEGNVVGEYHPGHGEGPGDPLTESAAPKIVIRDAFFERLAAAKKGKNDD